MRNCFSVAEGGRQVVVCRAQATTSTAAVCYFFFTPIEFSLTASNLLHLHFTRFCVVSEVVMVNGVIFVQRYEVKQLYSFLDYVFMVAVDFTASNRNPRYPSDSLCIIDPSGRRNAYQQILNADKGQRLECSTGRISTRDVVQFVQMREIHRGEISGFQALFGRTAISI